ncbi:lycopene cyclase domain-containing protein [Compostimonas suwonensis]|uniref:Lycopene cyclase domain-containing protein n=1 Tax=Compostimonas suwonensis TaxID=1048394 RepID=A0A2M9BZH1_9MICO|nr:lycopene cyclase domain-containing protein [Compostimonas suwonensis]PJJ63478.1 lycopene cyclase domain-containing protein [Compostimonas suwonensis]
MSYLLLDVAFLAVTVVVGAFAWRRRATRRMLPAAGIALAILLVLTAGFDTVMIAVGLVDYAPEHILGTLIGLAPIEDFAYPVAAVVLLPSLWVLLGRRPHDSGVTAHDD